MARPVFKPTTAQRRQVAIAAGAGMAHDDIAIGLGIARGTLTKHFAIELSQGACSRRLEVLDAMFKAAKGGNVTAQKAYVAMTPKVSALPIAPTAKPKGKKEVAAADAITAQDGTGWDNLLPKPGRMQ